MIWLQQAMAPMPSRGHGRSTAICRPTTFQQIFTAHGNIMVFFVAMAFIFGLINYIVPLQIGARDLASPFLNTLGFLAVYRRRRHGQFVLRVRRRVRRHRLAGYRSAFRR
jgi:heme/copper-type cytochrome/quinol oxidase subunit 1